MIEFVLGALVTLGCMAIVRRGPEVVDRALVEGSDWDWGDAFTDRELDLMTWNDLEHTYALHDGRPPQFVRRGRDQWVGDHEARADDPEAYAADRRIARWNQQEDVERLDTSELMALLVDAFDGVKARGP